MNWQPELDELAKRKALAHAMGGPEKIKRQHEHGKLTVRERIHQLLDPGTFREVGSITGSSRYDENGQQIEFTPANQIIGRGAIGGRTVAIYADDFTVRGGASDAGNKEKAMHVDDMAASLGIPLIKLVEGTGGSVRTSEKDGHAHLPGGRWDAMIGNLSRIPVVSLALGTTAGLGAARVCASHYSVMVRHTSQIFAGGPPLVAHLGEKLTKEELGGTAIHARNGTVDDEAATEGEAFQRTRQFLSYLPGSVDELPPRISTGDDPARREEKLLSIVPRERRRAYAMRPIIEAVVDQGSFFEMGRLWGRSAITGFARLDGWSVAILAGDPVHMGGAWSRLASEKVIRFVNLAQTFHLPLVHLVDTPGFPIGLEAEKESTIRLGMRAIAAITRCTIPWCAIAVRKVYGIAGAAHRPSGRYTMRYAWPSGEWGSIPIAGGLEAAYRSELASAADPEQRLAEIRKRLEALQSPFRTAEKFGVEEIIDPRDTRPLLCEFANLCAPRVKVGEWQGYYSP